MKQSAMLAVTLAIGACHRAPTMTDTATPTPTPTAGLSDTRRAPAPSSVTGSAALPTPELDGVATAAGTWRFQVSADGDQAVFGDAGEPSEFAMRCDADARRMVFTRAAADGSGATMQIVAADGAATLDASPTAEGRTRATDVVTDTFLTDVLADAQGRIGVKVGGGPTLAMPVDPVIGQTIRRCAAPHG
ncbi:hypothetical protein EAH79_06550 [Sphingomonas koreensis]|nr:hypothetical protein EAH79_06550 [Sphingomonas koreensis]